jgi:hypothetical protein
MLPAKACLHLPPPALQYAELLTPLVVIQQNAFYAPPQLASARSLRATATPF